NPEVGRFLNSDVVLCQQGIVQSTNMYSYCLNNPVQNVDYSGEFAITAAFVSSLAIFVVILMAIAVLYYAGVLDMPSASDVLSKLIIGYQNIKDLLEIAKKQLKIYLLSLVLTFALGKHDHHIVAQYDFRAIIGRYVLRISNIGINSQQNRVMVRTALHQVLHTNTYHALVTVFVTMAYLIGKGEAVSKTLQAFKLILGGF
ncbi:MAG: hypothetical protein PHC32_06645, partial [Candidatus Izemoplasmatales bacterium]|nr:hypothetical protein [Candidatus Izemoplasmatales bacterium]